MKQLFILLFSLSLIACDGFDLDAVDDTASSDEKFTRTELAFNILASSATTSETGFGGNRDGFIVLFKTSSTLDEIELRSSGDDSVLVGQYDWEIENNKLQVSYPNGVTCTSKKISETDRLYEASASCSGGTPRNDPIKNTLLKAVTFDQEDLSGLSITIENEDSDRKIDFFSNGNVEYTDLDDDGDEIRSTTKLGTYDESSIYRNNAVKAENPTANEYSLFVLLSGSMSSGTMLELRYILDTDALDKVYIYQINANDKWKTVSQYDDINIDN